MLKFSNIKDIISKTDLVELLFEDGSYETYRHIDDVPEKYDNWEVHGIGPVMSFDEKLVSRYTRAQEVYLVEEKNLKDAITLTENKGENKND